MSATICIVAESSTHKTILLTWVLPKERLNDNPPSVAPSNQLAGNSRAFGVACAPPMPSHHTPLHRAAAGVPADGLKVDATPNPKMGDLAVGCFAIAKAKGANPAQVAQEVAAAFT